MLSEEVHPDLPSSPLSCSLPASAFFALLSLPAARKHRLRACVCGLHHHSFHCAVLHFFQSPGRCTDTLKVAKGGKENRKPLMAATLPALCSRQIACYKSQSRISFDCKRKLLRGNVGDRETLKNNKISRTCSMLPGAHCVYSH